MITFILGSVFLVTILYLFKDLFKLIVGGAGAGLFLTLGIVFLGLDGFAIAIVVLFVLIFAPILYNY